MPYDPNQPRVPAGRSDGGRWTSGGGIALYRASKDDLIVGTASFSRDVNAAKAYLNNPGFGGPNLYTTNVSPTDEEVLDLFDADDPVGALEELTGEYYGRGRGVDELVPLHYDKLRELGYNWVRVKDSYPAGSETWIFIGGFDVEPDMEPINVARPQSVMQSVSRAVGKIRSAKR